MFYPGLTERIKAVIVDGIALIAMMYVAFLIFSSFEQVPEGARIAVFVFIFALYDPLMTSFASGTIGHHIIGIQVKKESDEERNIPIHLALLRFIIKASLGWISLLTVVSDAKRQALHDKAAGSVIVYK